VAAELVLENLVRDSSAIVGLRDQLEQGLLQQLPFAHVNGDSVPRLANTCNIRFGDIDAEIILNKLDKADICASSGSACTAGGTEPSQVLLSMGQSRVEALAAVRFSLSRYNTEQEVAYLLKVVPEIVRPLARMAA
jgi:cysteine desulfurase